MQSCCQDCICSPPSNYSVFCSPCSSPCACIMYLAPCQRYPFLPRLPSHFCHQFGSCLSMPLSWDYRLPSLWQTSCFPFYNLPFYQMKLTKLFTVQTFQDGVDALLGHRGQPYKEDVVWSGTACHPSSVFSFLPKSTGSSRLLPLWHTQNRSRYIRLAAL